MSSGKKLQQGHYLFRENDPSDAMYVIKSGKLVVTKSKQNSEIILAEIGPGAMVGEMAFFDGKPRSANVKAAKDSEVIALPFKALHAQFQTFPEWAKAIMRTVNNHLREANRRIKELDKTSSESEMFSPITINKLASIINLVGTKYGKKEGELLQVDYFNLRNYCIQIFQEPTHKMDKLMDALEELGFLKVVELGEGKKRIDLIKIDLLYSFVEWHNDWLYKKDDERISISPEELKILKAIIHFAKKVTPDAKGKIKLSLTDVQNESMKEMGYLVQINDINCLIEKKLVGDQMMEEKGIFAFVELADCLKMAPYWDILHSLKKIVR